MSRLSRLLHKKRAPLSAYLPLKAGASWYYHSGPVEALRENLSPELQPNVHRTGIGSVYLDGKRYEGLMSEAGCEAYDISDSEIAVRGGAEAEGRTARILLSAPAAVGSAWRALAASNHHSESRIAGTDRIETPAGSFECLRVETVSSTGSITACWYAPGVGLVQEYGSADDHMLLLHSYFIPPDDLTGSLQVNASGPGRMELLLGGNRTGLYGSHKLQGLIVGSHEVGAAADDFHVIKRTSVGVPEQQAQTVLDVPPAEEVRPAGLQLFVNRILQHPDGSLWFCTHGYGVWVYEPKRWLDSWYSLNPHNTLVDDYVTDAVFPAPDTALFGTRGRGVVVMSRSDQELSYRPLFGESEPAAEAFVTALGVCDGQLYVGTEDQGLLTCHSDGSELRRIDIADEAILCLASTDAGLLVGSESGAWLVRQAQAFPIEALAGRAVLSGYQRSSGELLVGLREGGLVAIEADAEPKQVEAEFLIHERDSVFDIAEDGAGDLYICTNQGVCELPAEGEARLFQVEGREGALAALRVGGDLWFAARPGVWRVSLDYVEE